MGTMAVKCITPYVLMTLILFSVVIAKGPKDQNQLSKWKYSSIPVKRKLIGGYEPELMSTFQIQNKDEVNNPMTNVPIINPTTPDTDNTPVANPVTSTPIIPMTPDPSTNPGFGGGTPSPNTNPGFGGGTPSGGTPSPNTNPGFGGGTTSPNTNPGFGGGTPSPNTNPGFGGGTNPGFGGGTPSPNTNPGFGGPAGTSGSWCVASQSASDTALQVALDYACGYGGTDCSGIQPGGNCYNPDTVRDHASYAFNQYYQKNPAPTSCDFGGTATLTNTDPSSQTCQYPSSRSSGNTGMGGGNTTPSTSTPSVPDMSSPISGSPQFGSVPPDSDLSSAVLNSPKWMLRCITMLAVIFYKP